MLDYNSVNEGTPITSSSSAHEMSGPVKRLCYSALVITEICGIASCILHARITHDVYGGFDWSTSDGKFTYHMFLMPTALIFIMGNGK